MNMTIFSSSEVKNACFMSNEATNEHTRDDQKVLGPLYFDLPGNEHLTITFQNNLPSRQCTYPISVRAFLSLQNRRPFPGPPSTRLLPL